VPRCGKGHIDSRHLEYDQCIRCKPWSNQDNSGELGLDLRSISRAQIVLVTGGLGIPQYAKHD
jgi:hypothetical protein